MTITFFMNNQAGFTTATAGLVSVGVEDFESSTLAPNSGQAVDDPIAPGVANGVFTTGTKTAVGVTVQSNTLGDDPATVSPRGFAGLSTASAGFLSTPDDQVSTNNQADSFDIIVDPPGSDPVTAVNLTPLYFDNAGVVSTDTLTIRVYDASNTLLGTATIVGGDYITEASFVGIVASGGDQIYRININDGSAAAIDYIGADDIQVFTQAPNTAPTVNNNTGLTLNEGGTGTITATELDFNDAEQGDTAISYTVTAVATNGTLSNNGSLLSLGGTFTQDDINNNLITYTHDGSETGSASFQFSVSDGAGGTVTGQTFTFTVTAANDAPTVSAPASIAVSEDVATAVTGVSFSDVDAGSGAVTATFSVASGALAASGGGGVTVGGTAQALTLTGTIANINTFIAGSNLNFTTALNATSDVTLNIGIDDGGNTGTGGAQTGGGSLTLEVADVNDAPVIGFGTMDIVTTNNSFEDISILLANGAGGFTNTNLSVWPAGQPHTVATGDFNDDGLLDVVTANLMNHTIGLLLGDGTGGFTASEHSIGTLPSNPRGLAVGDVDGDDDLDVVTGNVGTSDITILRNDGTGIFTADPALAAGGGNQPFAVALGDLNGDGDLDIVTANATTHNVSVLLNDGAGGYTLSETAVGGAPMSVALGDLNGDGDLDIVTANNSDNDVSVLLGDGTGGFASASSVAVGGFGTISVALGDLNGDGILDIVAANFNSDNVGVMLGDGAGGYVLSTIAVGSGPNSVTVSDINGDGKLDIATANSTSDNVSVLLGDGAGGFTDSGPFSVGVGTTPRFLALGNFDTLQLIDEDPASPLVFNAANGNAITLSDADSGGADETVTLDVAHGDLTLATTVGLTSVLGDGTSSVTLTGSVAEINAALDGLSYQSDGDYNGRDTLAISADDNGHTGSGGALTAGKLVPIVVEAVNDDPSATGVPSDVTVIVDAASNLNLSAMTFSDADSGANDVTFTLAASAGTLAGTSGGSVTVGGAGTDTLTLTGTAADIDAFLNTPSNIQYTGPSGVRADNAATITLTANDGGHSGTGGGGNVALGTVNVDIQEQPSLVVTTLDDTVDAFDGETSLREAVDYANSHAGTDTITFATGPGTVRLTDAAGTLVASEELIIDGDIDNDDAPDITITGDAAGNDATLAGGITDIFNTSTANLADNVAIIYSTGSESLTFNGVVLTGGVTGSGGAINSAADLTLTNSIVSGNQSFASGGAISAFDDATLTNVVVSGNRSVNDTGGGILVINGTLNLTDSTVSGNSANGDGGGISAFNTTILDSTVSGNSAGGSGGGMYIYGTADITSSTISGNTSGGAGGGMIATTAELTNVTVSGNQAVIAGGGVYTNLDATVTNSTITGNDGGAEGGGIDVNTGTLINSIVMGNAAASGAETFAFSSPFVLTGGNIIGTDVFSGGSVVASTTLAAVFAAVGLDPNTNLQSGVLADNGGPVWTVALNPANANPAIDAADGSAPATDATGVTRYDNPYVANGNGGTGADLGAYEHLNEAPRITLEETLDVVIAEPASDGVAIAVGVGDGTLLPYGGEFTGTGPEHVVLGDFDGNGQLDILTSDAGDGTLTVLLQVECGCFEEADESPITPAVTGVGALVTGYLNADAILDVAVAGESSGAVQILFGDGDGTFTAGGQIATGALPIDIVLADLDGDTDLDVVSANAAGGTISAALNDGSGVFATAADSAASPMPAALAAGDLDGDDVVDVVVADALTDSVVLLSGNGDGTFDAGVSFAVGATPSDVALGDVDGDGDLDIVAANHDSDNVSVLLGNDDGTFAAQQTFAAGDGPNALELADMNNDGNLDIVAVHDDSSVHVMLGRGDGTFLADPAPLDSLTPFTGLAIGNIDAGFEDSNPLLRTFYEGTVLTLTPGLVLNDVEGDTIQGATVFLDSLGGPGGLPGDVLTATVTVAGITAVWNPATFTLTFSGPASAADYQAVLRGVTFSSGSDPDDGGSLPLRIVGITVDDGSIDGEGFSAPIFLSIASVTDDAVIAQENAVLSGDVFAANPNFADSLPLFEVVAVNGVAADVGTQIVLASGALLTLNADGTFSYDPNGVFDDLPDFFASGASNTTATDSFTYTAAGGSTATVTVTIRGVDSNDLLLGAATADHLFGGIGNDTVDGGLGADTMVGAAGNDTYVLDSADDVVGELTGGGTDTVKTSLVNIDLNNAGHFGEIENVTLTGGSDLNVTANGLDNRLTGNGAANVLDGGGGADTMAGAAGNDTYILDSADDVVGELTGGGNDTVKTALINIDLNNAGHFGEIENVTLTGSSNLNVTGNGLDNKLTGNGAANVLNGGSGADTMAGAAGNDTYVLDSADDVAGELVGGGTDTVKTSLVNIDLNNAGHFGEIENVTLTGGSSLNATGNSLDNRLTGNVAANMLDGGGGADTMAGAAGNDTYVLDSADDVAGELTGEGTDTVKTSLVNVDLNNAGHFGEIENVTLTGSSNLNVIGNGLANRLTGNSAANVLDGGSGADTMAGAAGGDTYVVDSAGDVVGELVGGGTDTVKTSLINIDLNNAGHFGEIENVTLTGSGNLNVIGNGLANVITGNAGSNVLDGGLGADTMNGLGGPDFFRFTSVLGGGNIDTVLGYSVADDSIRIDNAVFSGLAAGALAAQAFFTGAAAHDLDDRIIYNSATGALLFDADGNQLGGVAAVQFATLANGLAMTAGEFEVI